MTRIGGAWLSRANALMLYNAEREAIAEQKAAERAAQARREAAEVSLQRYFAEHGEWPHETHAREQAALAQREAAIERRRQAELAEKRQAMEAQWLMSGRRPRSHEEILAAARAIS